MRVVFEEDDKIWPRSLLHEGKAWLSMYEYASKSKDANKLLPGIYSLFSGLEMYLKAYIVLKDNNYASPHELKKLGHNFNIMSEQIKRLAPRDLYLIIGKELSKYKLKTLDINKLKYPQARRFWHVDYGLNVGEHTLDKIFKRIEEEVENEMEKWITDNYPRTSQITVLLHGVTEIVDSKQAQAWFNMCHTCRPHYVSAFKQISWPWCLEEQPLEFCSKCRMPYKPDRLRA